MEITNQSESLNRRATGNVVLGTIPKNPFHVSLENEYLYLHRNDDHIYNFLEDQWKIWLFDTLFDSKIFEDFFSNDPNTLFSTKDTYVNTLTEFNKVYKFEHHSTKLLAHYKIVWGDNLSNESSEHNKNVFQKLRSFKLTYFEMKNSQNNIEQQSNNKRKRKKKKTVVLGSSQIYKTCYEFLDGLLSQIETSSNISTSTWLNFIAKILGFLNIHSLNNGDTLIYSIILVKNSSSLGDKRYNYEFNLNSTKWRKEELKLKKITKRDIPNPIVMENFENSQSQVVYLKIPSGGFTEKQILFKIKSKEKYWEKMSFFFCVKILDDVFLLLEKRIWLIMSLSNLSQRNSIVPTYPIMAKNILQDTNILFSQEKSQSNENMRFARKLKNLRIRKVFIRMLKNMVLYPHYKKHIPPLDSIFFSKAYILFYILDQWNVDPQDEKEIINKDKLGKPLKYPPMINKNIREKYKIYKQKFLKELKEREFRNIYGISNSSSSSSSSSGSDREQSLNEKLKKMHQMANEFGKKSSENMFSSTDFDQISINIEKEMRYVISSGFKSSLEFMAWCIENSSFENNFTCTMIHAIQSFILLDATHLIKKKVIFYLLNLILNKQIDFTETDPEFDDFKSNLIFLAESVRGVPTDYVPIQFVKFVDNGHGQKRNETDRDNNLKKCRKFLIQYYSLCYHPNISVLDSRYLFLSVSLAHSHTRKFLQNTFPFSENIIKLTDVCIVWEIERIRLACLNKMILLRYLKKSCDFTNQPIEDFTALLDSNVNIKNEDDYHQLFDQCIVETLRDLLKMQWNVVGFLSKSLNGQHNNKKKERYWLDDYCDQSTQLGCFDNTMIKKFWLKILNGTQTWHFMKKTSMLRFFDEAIFTSQCRSGGKHFSQIRNSLLKRFVSIYNSYGMIDKCQTLDSCDIDNDTLEHYLEEEEEEEEDVDNDNDDADDDDDDDDDDIGLDYNNANKDKELEFCEDLNLKPIKLQRGFLYPGEYRHFDEKFSSPPKSCATVMSTVLRFCCFLDCIQMYSKDLNNYTQFKIKSGAYQQQTILKMKFPEGDDHSKFSKINEKKKCQKRKRKRNCAIYDKLPSKKVKYAKSVVQQSTDENVIALNSKPPRIYDYLLNDDKCTPRRKGLLGALYLMLDGPILNKDIFNCDFLEKLHLDKRFPRIGTDETSFLFTDTDPTEQCTNYVKKENGDLTKNEKPLLIRTIIINTH
jgi:hypothetical protein